MKKALSLVEASGSHYYTLKSGHKVRVSDHTPTLLPDNRWGFNLTFYTMKKGMPASIKEQLTKWCAKRNCSIGMFSEIIRQFSAWDRYVAQLKS